MTNPMLLSDKERELIAKAYNKERDIHELKHVAKAYEWMDAEEVKKAPWEELYKRYEEIKSPLAAKHEAMLTVITNYVMEEKGK